MDSHRKHRTPGLGTLSLIIHRKIRNNVISIVEPQIPLDNPEVHVEHASAMKLCHQKETSSSGICYFDSKQ